MCGRITSTIFFVEKWCWWCSIFLLPTNDSKKLFSSKADTSYNNVCLIYIVNFIEGTCLSRVSVCLIFTWVAK